MDRLLLSANASTRMRQRGIQRELVEPCLPMATVKACMAPTSTSMDRQTRQHVREKLGAKNFARLETSLHTYLAVGEDGTLVTTARRLRRFRR